MTSSDLLASDAAEDHALLRTWGLVLVLAFVTGRPWPDAPASLRRRWPCTGPGIRECVLAAVDEAVTVRAGALRVSYDPARLAAVAAMMAGRLLAGPARPELPSSRAGQVWVPPQIRWLHEVHRLSRQGGVPCHDDLAPPLDYGLAGLRDWPGIRVGDRLDNLLRHRLSASCLGNRHLARVALLGEGPAAQADSLSAAHCLTGWRPPDWLEVVLSWSGTG